ncbi:hypothetical protein CBS115989_1274 [Aspergillus niger]|nr:hypothetical protein ANI_1_1718144 [Aspergillus niger CBS 513.88]KAI2823685.1 hypothetical protein CBS115989_1274 [Aspergillus niger]KAI2838140.1 hypothetical protein CBS11350_8354 [Aspergillus niger]KAI2858706.1 hypothetical protein CBS11232_2472 [Aspergillus niger]KAI2866235.1 hypothetical protein CBS12448_1343 [Aspergillus niger]KAI2879575.1 hypothetical protein CBS115988_2111 [Aspergillus niger]|eukprot:XP_001397745.2 hypothetical protein ANI_1_1718144 [Aspergillus niger CBS 513.88]
MSVFLRSRLSLRATPSIAARQLAPLRSAYPLGQRFYAHSSYGGDGETEAQQPDNPRNQPTRDIEHPGPPPPDTGSSSTAKSSSGSSSSSSKQPSNKAHPTLADGDESPYVDKDGHTTADAPEDVRRHNEEIEKRADRPTERAG